VQRSEPHPPPIPNSILLSIKPEGKAAFQGTVAPAALQKDSARKRSPNRQKTESHAIRGINGKTKNIEAAGASRGPGQIPKRKKLEGESHARFRGNGFQIVVDFEIKGNPFLAVFLLEFKLLFTVDKDSFLSFGFG
jgi:hypothetical protein